MSIRLPLNVFTLGQSIPATVLVRNTTTNQVQLPGPQYKAIKFVVRDREGNALPPPQPEKILQSSGGFTEAYPDVSRYKFSDDIQRLHGLINPKVDAACSRQPSCKSSDSRQTGFLGRCDDSDY